MSFIEKFGPLIGRIAIAWLFIPAGWSKIAGFAGTTGYIASKGLPMASMLAAIALVIELFGGLAILLGYRARIAALALALFTLVAAVFFHNYWALPADQQMLQKIMFDKNIAIIGGLLFVAAFGSGPLSLDRRGTR